MSLTKRIHKSVLDLMWTLEDMENTDSEPPQSRMERAAWKERQARNRAALVEGPPGWCGPKNERG